MASRNPEVGSRWREKERPKRIVEVLEQPLVEGLYNPRTVLIKSITVANKRAQAFPSRVPLDSFHHRFEFVQGPRFLGYSDYYLMESGYDGDRGVSVAECSECSAIVIDTAKHDAWHDR